MSDIFGGLIDKLTTINLKMWNNQELIYKIRRMTFEEYKKEYFENELGAEKLWNSLKNACDLNLQRNELIDEIDKFIIEIIDCKLSGVDLDSGKYIQRKHKTY